MKKYFFPYISCYKLLFSLLLLPSLLINSGNTSNASAALTPFVGTWLSHGQSLVIREDGHATYIARTYRWCNEGFSQPCDTTMNNYIEPGIHTEIFFTQVKSNSTSLVAYGTMLPAQAGQKVITCTVKLAANNTIIFSDDTDPTPKTLCGQHAPIGLCGA